MTARDDGRAAAQPVPGVITLDRAQLAALLAHHADVLAARWRVAAPGPGAWEITAALSLTSHANDLTETETEEAPAVAELLDAILDFPDDGDDSINLIADAVMDAYASGHRVEVLAEAVRLIGAARAASGAMYPCDLAYINRRVGMREAIAVLRREYEPEPEPPRRPRVRRDSPTAEPEEPS